MRRISLLLIALAGCARTAGSTHARAHAGSDAHVAVGATASFAGSCEGCSGTAKFSWSFAVAPPLGACALTGASTASAQVKCTAPGEWVLELAVSDAHGDGTTDYANLRVGPPPDAGNLDAGATDAGTTDAGNFDAGNFDAGNFDAGNLDAGPTDAGNFDAGNLDAGNLDAGPTDAGPPDSGGGLTGTLAVTAPDGSPVTSTIPGDLLELHATPSDGSATCAFDTAPANAQYLTATNACDAAIVLLAPASNVTFGVTFTLGGQTFHATSSAVTAKGATKINSSALAVSTVAVDPITESVVATRPGHSVLVAAAGQAPTTRFNTTDGVSCAGGTVRDVAFPAGDMGRVFSDAGTATNTSSAGGFVSCATAAGFDGTSYQPVMASTDRTYFVAWPETGTGTEDNTFNVDAIFNVEDPASWGDVSAGVLTLTNGDTLQYVDWATLHDFAINQTGFTAQDVPTTLTGLATAVTGPLHDGTLWLADDQGALYEYQGTLLTSTFTLELTPDAQLAAAPPVTALALEHDGPWAEDVWAVANGAVQRVAAAPNTVGAQPVVLSVDVGLGGATANGVAVGLVNGSHAIYIAASNGLYLLAP